ncbi:hypothetical protein [Nonomuraea pusilla]|uniref:Uncharacterized protein n=1 Tax=Nonomuraea pusilla TaxID=46177 RepID=A0A1H8FWI5_9ACTN|nr:hypothetical protein [Nonomuraea pusilla]SEN35894.1 hypothetical protein SAMN05660976_07377 [Nonomuraea pusilla]
MKRFLPAALLLGGVLAAPPASAAAASDVAQLTMPYILAPVYEGQCRPVAGLTASALVTTDRDTEVSYRLVVDGTPGVTRTQQLRAGLRQTIGDFWYSGTTTGVTGTVRIEVLNQNMPFREAPYSITCRQADVPAGGVGVSAFTPMAYYGDCLEAPYVTAHGTFRAPAGTQLTWRWVVDGVPGSYSSTTVPPSGYLSVQSAYWTRQPRYSGAVRLEALGYGNPFAEALYPIRCQGSPKR